MRKLTMLLLVAGCGAPPTGGQPPGEEKPDLAVAANPPDLARPQGGGADLAQAPAADLAQPAIGYPPGPYGGTVGDVLPNFTFQGYWSPTKTTGLATTQPFGAVTLDMARTSGARYGMIFLAGFS
jgi:hypothetical protein